MNPEISHSLPDASEAPTSPERFTTKQVREGNDSLRHSLLNGPESSVEGRVVFTPTVAYNPNSIEILEAVRDFSEFNTGDDPHAHHDFGAFDVEGERFYFKIDYYDLKMQYGVNPYQEMPLRVLTIMRADEY